MANKEFYIGDLSFDSEDIIGELSFSDFIKVQPQLEDLYVTPTVNEQHFRSRKDGYNNVTVSGISDINLIPDNIKKDVTIFGVTGNIDVTITDEDLQNILRKTKLILGLEV